MQCTVGDNCLNFLLLRPKHFGSFAQNSFQIDLSIGNIFNFWQQIVRNAAFLWNATKAYCTVGKNCLNFLLLRPKAKHIGSFAQNSVQIDLILRCRLLRCSNSGVKQILVSEICNATNGCCTVGDNYLNFLIIRPKHTGSFAQKFFQIDLTIGCTSWKHLQFWQQN